MKIICIGRNYADHAKELNNAVPTEPVFFLKPDSAVLQKRHPFVIPWWTNDVHYELEVVLRISRLGKTIGERFAHKYYDQIGLGIDFTARDVQQQLKDKGLPWEKAKGFDGAAVLGQFRPISQFPELNNIDFQLRVNGETRQHGNTRDLLFSFDQLIAHVSQFMTLKMGDLIFTGTPAGVGPVREGDELKGYIGDEELLRVKVK